MSLLSTCRPISGGHSSISSRACAALRATLDHARGALASLLTYFACTLGSSGPISTAPAPRQVRCVQKVSLAASFAWVVGSPANGGGDMKPMPATSFNRNWRSQFRILATASSSEPLRRCDVTDELDRVIERLWATGVALIDAAESAAGRAGQHRLSVDVASEQLWMAIGAADALYESLRDRSGKAAHPSSVTRSVPRSDRRNSSFLRRRRRVAPSLLREQRAKVGRAAGRRLGPSG